MGSVRTPIIGRPRPLPRQRRAHPDYTLNCEEPVYSRLAKDAGLAHLHPHMLRHAAASLLSAAGVPIEDISDTVGHRSVNVTAEIYRHPIAPVRSGHMVAMNQLIDRPRGRHSPA